MKTQRLTSILGSSLVAGALTIGALATTQSASAQSNTAVGQATIPFAFQLSLWLSFCRESDIGSSHTSGVHLAYDKAQVFNTLRQLTCDEKIRSFSRRLKICSVLCNGRHALQGVR